MEFEPNIRESGQFFLEEEEVLSWNLDLPSFDVTKPAEKRLQQYYDKVAQSWKNHWSGEIYWLSAIDLVEKRENSRIFTPWRVSLVGESIEISNKLCSVGLLAKEKRGKSLENQSFSSDLWDISTGFPVSPRNLPPVLGKKKQDLLQTFILQGESRENFATVPEFKMAMNRHFSWKHIHFTEETADFYFPQGTIAPHVEGIPRFSIPFQ